MSWPYLARLAACMGKQRFMSFAEARRVVDRPGRRPQIAFKCRFCGGVHIGERDIQRERADRRRRSEQTREDANAD